MRTKRTAIGSNCLAVILQKGETPVSDALFSLVPLNPSGLDIAPCLGMRMPARGLS